MIVSIIRFKTDRNKGENIRSPNEVSPLILDGFRHGSRSGNMKQWRKEVLLLLYEQYVEKMKRCLWRIEKRNGWWLVRGKSGVVGGIKRSRRYEWRGERKKVELELLVCIRGRGLFIRWRARAAAFCNGGGEKNVRRVLGLVKYEVF